MGLGSWFGVKKGGVLCSRPSLSPLTCRWPPITSLYVPNVRLKQIFGVVIVVMTVYRIFKLLG